MPNVRHVTKSRNAVNAHMCLYSFCAQVSYFIARTARHLSAHPTNKARPLRLGGPRRASRASARPRRRACVCPPRAPAHARRMCPDPPRQVECTRQCGAGETLAARARPSMSRPDVSIKGSTLQASRRARSLISVVDKVLRRGGELGVPFDDFVDRFDHVLFGDSLAARANGIHARLDAH